VSVKVKLGGVNLFLVKVREAKIGEIFKVGVSDFELIQRCYKSIVGYISISFYAVVVINIIH